MAELRLPNAPTPAGVATPTAARGGMGRRLFWPVIFAAVMFVASSRSYVAAPGFTRMDDKFAHFAAFGLLATLVCRVGEGWRAAVRALVIVAIYAASDEWHQSFVPGRYSDVGDWIADTAGAAVAVTAYAGWTWYRRWLETPLAWRKRRVA